MLRCSFCALAWELAGYALHLLRRRRRPLRHGGAGHGPAGPARSRLCGTCRSYLKTVDVPELSPFPLLAIADLETMDLDMAAMEQGYRAGRAATATFSSAKAV